MKTAGSEKAIILEEMQRWYNADKTLSMQGEFIELLSVWDDAAPNASAADRTAERNANSASPRSRCSGVGAAGTE